MARTKLPGGGGRMRHSAAGGRLAAAAAACCIAAAACGSNAAALEAISVDMTEAESDFILGYFDAIASNASTSADSTWARRSYASMAIYQPELRKFKAKIEKKLPGFVVAFDVIFEAADRPVPWHVDHDSLGPFENGLLSGPLQQFVTVHTNLRNARGGRLATLDVPALAALHGVVNRCFNNFGLLHGMTEPFARWARHRSSDLRMGHVFNNLALHSVSAGRGRVSYVVRLVRSDVVVSRHRMLAMASGDHGTTSELSAFARFLPFLPADMRAADFPWSRVPASAGLRSGRSGSSLITVGAPAIELAQQ